MFCLPRYAVIIYLRVYNANVLLLQPRYWTSALCLLIVVLQVTLLYIQQQHGVRSILPKFMYWTEFKYFINEPE